MYDNIDIMLKSDQAPGTDFMSQTPLYFDVTGEHRFDGGFSLTGNLGNLRVSVTGNRVKISDGSLCKWYLGDNFQTLTRGDTKRAIEMLSDKLHLPLNNADITRIDIAQNFIMKHPPEVYFNHLGQLPRYNRLPQPNGIYYQNGNRQIILYNKVKEQKAKGQTIPELYRERNVLRYELRHKNRLREVFNRDRVTGADLYNEPFYMQIIDKWHTTYEAIQKINLIQIDFTKMTTKRELYLASLADLVTRQGGELLFMNQLNEAAKRREITPKQKIDLKRAVKEACGSTINTKESDLTSELDKKVLDAVKFYR